MPLPMLDPDLLKAFAAVAEQRSFTRAATQLNRTQSAVSMQIKRLEDRLGVVLFHRTTLQVELSTSGEALLGYARRILALNDEAVERVRGQRTEGRVRLGLMDDYGTHVLPNLLADFVRRHPQVHVELETGLTARMPERLGEDFDLVIAMHAHGRGDGELLRREQAVWAASATHRPETRDTIPVALYPPGCLFREWAIEALDAAHRPWNLCFVSPSLAAVESAANEGLGVTVVKSGVFPARLRALSRGDGMPSLPTADIRLHRAANLPRAADLLGDHLVSAFAATA